MSTEPQDWESALVAAGVVDRRSGRRGSWTRLAEMIGVHTSTLTAMRDGTKETEQAILNRVAEALRLDPRTVSDWAGRVRSERSAYRPPKDADLLSNEERKAVNNLIALLAKPKKRGQTDDAATSPAEKSDDGGGATVTRLRLEGSPPSLGGAMAARSGDSTTDAYRQSVAGVGEESQIREDEDEGGA